MSDVILVHGSWHGAWCWSRLKPHLEALGLKTRSVDLAGCGDDQTPAASVTQRSWIEPLTERLEDLDEPAVVVGHSLGGVAISLAAETVPAKVAKLIYLNALVPRDGDSTFDLAKRHALVEVSAMRFDLSDDGLTTIVDPACVREAFYGDCDAGDVRWAQMQLRPQPVATLSEPVQLSADRYGRVPRFFIICGSDRAVPPAIQRAMAKEVGCDAVHELDASHSPFISNPSGLAGAISKIATTTLDRR